MKDVYKQKTNKHFLKVVQGYSISLTSTVAIIPTKIKGLQRVSVRPKSPLWSLGGRSLFTNPYGQIKIPQIEEDVYKSCR